MEADLRLELSTGDASQGVCWMMGSTPSLVRFDITLLSRSGNGERLDLTPF
jgi:hypothetical protein